MIWNNLFSKKNLQETLQICIIILDCKKFFDSTFIFIILFVRDSLNKALNYYLKFTRNSLNFHSLKKTSIQNINLSSTFISTTSIFSHHDTWCINIYSIISFKSTSIVYVIDEDKSTTAWEHFFYQTDCIEENFYICFVVNYSHQSEKLKCHFK